MDLALREVSGNFDVEVTGIGKDSKVYIGYGKLSDNLPTANELITLSEISDSYPSALTVPTEKTGISYTLESRLYYKAVDGSKSSEMVLHSTQTTNVFFIIVFGKLPNSNSAYDYTCVYKNGNIWIAHDGFTSDNGKVLSKKREKDEKNTILKF